jgi:CheY-like chemotaxis protein
MKIIILSTARSFYEDLEQARAFGAASYLLKPITTDNILFALQT